MENPAVLPDDVRVLECFLGCESLVWVEDQQLPHQVQGMRGSPWHDITEWSLTTVQYTEMMQ